MPADEQVLAVVRGWVQKAEGDLKTAALVFRAGEEGTIEAIVFHAQQCVEKYLKALLSWEGIDFPKTHDLGQLILLLPSSAKVDLAPEEQRRLSVYATATRDPGDYDPVTRQEARRALATARRIRAHVRKNLPIPSLRSRDISGNPGTVTGN
jgi:HEPN domain-containing protein